jgi:hypothetical protein
MKPTTENIITRNPKTDEVIGIYQVSISHLRNPIAKEGEKPLKNWSDESDQWLVVINGQRFDYYTGIGHRKIDMTTCWGTKWSGDSKYVIQNRHKLRISVLVECSKPVTPKFDSILACLVHDAVGSAQTFDDWCSGYGYDTDSRKALQSYIGCQETAKKLRLARVPLEKEAERLQDY